MAFTRKRKIDIVIGTNINQIRCKHDPKMTQTDLAKALKLTRTSVINLEKGRHGLTMSTLLDISKVFNVPVTRFFKGLL